MLVDGNVVILEKGDLDLGRPRKAKRTVWAKELERVDQTKENGYAFEGRFLRVLGDPAWIDDKVHVGAFIVATFASGSTKHPSTGIALVRVTAEKIEQLYVGSFDTKSDRIRAIKEIAEIFEREKNKKTSKTYIANAFSLNMIESEEATISIKVVDVETVKQIIANEEVESVIGHESTAKILSQLLGTEVKAERKEVKLKKGDKVVVFQLLQRLQEGAVLSEEELKQLQFKFFLVQI